MKIILSREWNSSEVWPVVEGSIADWPFWAAKAVLAAAARWSNSGWYRAFADGDIGSSVKLELIDEVAGGGEVYECSPIISSTQYCPAGEKLDNALHVVLEALR